MEKWSPELPEPQGLRVQTDVVVTDKLKVTAIEVTDEGIEIPLEWSPEPPEGCIKVNPYGVELKELLREIGEGDLSTEDIYALAEDGVEWALRALAVARDRVAEKWVRVIVRPSKQGPNIKKEVICWKRRG